MTKPSHYATGARSSRKRQRAAVHQERWAKRRRHKSSSSRECHESSHAEDPRIEDVALARSSVFTFPALDLGWWQGDSADSLLTRLPLSMFGVCRWCVDKFGQSVEVAKDTMFPSRVFQRELATTREQITALMEEVERLKKQKNQDESSSSDSTDVPHCCQCNHQHVGENTGTTQQPGTSAPDGTSGALIPSGPPPPAPPPPPPPPPPPAIATGKLKIVQKKKGGSKKVQSPKRVTLEDIQNVKLKKTSPNKPRRSKPPQAVGGPLVSLSALKKIKLKRTSQPGDENLNPKMVLRNRIPQEAMQFRTQLRKVHQARSPGGTPVRGRVGDDGTGLTPTMARALRRKFEATRTPSPREPLSSPPLRN